MANLNQILSILGLGSFLLLFIAIIVIVAFWKGIIAEFSVKFNKKNGYVLLINNDNSIDEYFLNLKHKHIEIDSGKYIIFNDCMVKYKGRNSLIFHRNDLYPINPTLMTSKGLEVELRNPQLLDNFIMEVVNSTKPIDFFAQKNLLIIGVIIIIIGIAIYQGFSSNGEIAQKCVKGIADVLSTLNSRVVA